MFKNYIKIFFRNLFKHSSYSISNIAGLAIGMVTCILLLLFVRYEFNWNTSNENYENIYRVQQKVFFNNEPDIYTQTGYALAGELKREFPEIEEAITIQEIWGEYLSTSNLSSKENDLPFFEKHGYFADSDVFKIFTFNFLKGNPNTALNEPFTIVLTEELAKKYFPKDDAYGKTMKASKNKFLKVTGIIENLPQNLDFKPDYLVSLKTIKEVANWKDFDQTKNIDAAAFRTYVLLNPNISVKNVNDKIYNLIDKYLPNNYKKLYLKPLSEIHLTANETDDIKVALYYSGGIAIFILILACINYINLATASSNLRKKEIGIRKVVGASKRTLFAQFVGEALLYSFFAMLLAFMLAEFLLPYFSTIVQRQLNLDFIRDLNFILLILSSFVITGILSGIYPALFLSSFQPVDVIKGNLSFFSKKKKSNSKGFIRKSLVTFQFFISISMIISTIFVAKQVNFMKNKDLGFKKDNLLLCKVFGEKGIGNFETLKNELLRNPDVINASVSLTAPFNGYRGHEISWEGGTDDDKIGIGYNSVGYDFINTYQMEIVKGRNFSKQFSTDSTACIINETALQQLGWEDPLGKKIDNNKYTIIGVIKDFHSYSVHVKIQPFYMVLNPGKLNDIGIYSIRIKPENKEKTLSFINQQFHSFFPGSIIEVASFDKDLQYGTEDVWEILKKIFLVFAVIAVLIAANGLFGLISFAAQRRIKEVGIRKVFGAKSYTLYIMMSKEFLYILIFALFTALPIGYIVSITTPGAYKYQLQFGDYFITAIIMISTALAATVYHTTKAVISNPVDTLKYE